MLKAIHIKSFRSCKDVRLEGLGSLTALVGRNGSGKTNILRAIDWMARSATSTDLLKPVPTSIAADMECEGSLYRFSFSTESFSTEVDESVPRHVSNKQYFLCESLAVLGPTKQWENILDRREDLVRVPDRPEPIKIGAMRPCLPALMALLPEAAALLQHVRSVLSFLIATRYYPIDEANEISGIDSRGPLGGVSDDEYQEWVRQYRSTGNAEDSVLMRLIYTYYEQKPKFDELQALLGPKGLGLIRKMEVATIELPIGLAENDMGVERQKLHFVTFWPGPQVGSGRHTWNFEHLSLGTRRVLHLLVTLIVDGSALMLLEHPEDGIHRGLLRKLIGLLRTNADPTQIIFSSHSAFVLNALDAQDIRLVSIHRGATEVRALTPKEITAACHFIEEEGTLADFLESVEG